MLSVKYRLFAASRTLKAKARFVPFRRANSVKMPLISIVLVLVYVQISSSQQSYESYIILLGRIVVGLVKSLNPGGFTFGSISLLLISKRFRSSLKK